MTREVSRAELRARRAAGEPVVVIDVRSEEEFALGSWAGFQTVNCSPSALPLLFVNLLASLASLASMLIPGGLGAVEGVYMTILPSLTTITPADALVGCIAIREAQLLSLAVSVPAIGWMARRLQPVPPK